MVKRYNNSTAVREIHHLGVVIEHATKVIREQQEIRRKAKNRFRELLVSYPQAREICYEEAMDEATE